jgi:Fur family ferric uptake transcriptional regulator
MAKPGNFDQEEILKEHNLKVTAHRVSVLSIFFQKNKVLSLSELSTALGRNFDRITLYRTLNAFEEQGLIHRIPDKSGNITYALCKHDSIQHSHDDNHVHFKCEICEKTFCLEDVIIPVIQLQKKFKAKRYNFLVEGICKDCNK